MRREKESKGRGGARRLIRLNFAFKFRSFKGLTLPSAMMALALTAPGVLAAAVLHWKGVRHAPDAFAALVPLLFVPRLTAEPTPDSRPDPFD